MHTATVFAFLLASATAQPRIRSPPPLNATTIQPLNLRDPLFGEPLDFHETNPLETPYGPLAEGDMLFQPNQDRKGITEMYLWKNRQYFYTIADESIRAPAEDGIRFWRENSCLSFTEVSPGSQQPRVEFVVQTGCWSHVGCVAQFQPSGYRTQQLSLGSGCTGHGTVTHEIGHSLGFYHEQSRSDRDDYIEVLWDNIKTSATHNFNKVTDTQNSDVPYDFGSVMHYGSKFFSKNTKDTIRTRDPTKQSLIGQRNGPSFRDVALLNKIYRCDQLCAAPPLCTNGGYVSADCRCHCPPGTSGAGCQTVTGGYYPEPACGGTVTAPGAIASPNWPSVYPEGSNCVWWLKPPAGRRARVTFSQFNILFRVQDTCNYEYMEISTNGVLGEGEKFCSDELTNVSKMSTAADGTMILHFKAFWKYYAGKGFAATVNFV